MAKKPYKTLPLHFVSQDFLNNYAKYGYNLACRMHNHHSLYKNDKYENICEMLVNELENNPSILDNLCSIEAGSHMIYDRHGVPMAKGIHFDYIYANMNAEHYNIRKAAEHLLKNPAVIMNARKNMFSDGVWDNAISNIKETKKLPSASSTAEAIQEIPHYNGGGSCLEFIWAASKEEMSLILEKAISYRTNNPNSEFYRAIFDLDLLGLRKCGAALSDNFYESSSDLCDEDGDSPSMD
jgi:hypothetical protein